MIRRTVILMLSAAALAGAVQAMQSSDSPLREPQLRAYRRELREKYAEGQIKRQAEAVRAYEQTRSDIFTPPWLRNGAQAAAPSAPDAAASKTEKALGKSHRLTISIVFLILIGAVAGWVRHATREVDGQ